MNIKNTLGKNERLKSRKLIEKIFREGKSFSVFPFRICYSINNSALHHSPLTIHNSPFPIQAGFSASSRNFKRAVDRNRIKRLMRECYRLQKKPLYALAAEKNIKLSIFFIYTSKELPEYKNVYEKMGVTLQKLIALFNEKVSPHT
jgi:ribonuclease P protein component